MYGMGMIRLREIVYTNYLNNGRKESATDYQNKLAYKIGVKVKVNRKFRASLKSATTGMRQRPLMLSTMVTFITSVKIFIPYFSLAYMKWNPGCMFMDVGIIPVAGSSLMDLIGNSMLNCSNNAIAASPYYPGGAYRAAAHIPWASSPISAFQEYALVCRSSKTTSNLVSM